MPSIAIIVAVIPTPHVSQIHREGSAIGVVIVADQRVIVIGDVREPVTLPDVIKVATSGGSRTELGDAAQAVILEGVGGEAPAEILGQRGEMMGGGLPGEGDRGRRGDVVGDCVPRLLREITIAVILMGAVRVVPVVVPRAVMVIGPAR